MVGLWEKWKIRLVCQQYTLNGARDITRSMEDLEIEIAELQNLREYAGKRGHIKVLKNENKPDRI